MKIGDKVTTRELAQTDSTARFVLVDLWDGYDGTVAGGTIKYIEPTKVKSGNRRRQLRGKGVESLTVGGGLTDGFLGEEFVR